MPGEQTAPNTTKSTIEDHLSQLVASHHDAIEAGSTSQGQVFDEGALTHYVAVLRWLILVD